MKWLFHALITTIFATGCGSTHSTVNPFMGPTVVPPPGTGEAARPSAGVPYYQSAPPPGAAPNYSVPQYQQPPPQFSVPQGSTSRNEVGASGGNFVSSSSPALRAEQALAIPTDAQPLVLNRRIEPPPPAAPPAIVPTMRFDQPQTLPLAIAPQQPVQPRIVASTQPAQRIVQQPQVFVQQNIDPCACQPASYATGSYASGGGREISDLPRAGSLQANAQLQARTATVLAALPTGQPTLAAAQQNLHRGGTERAVVQAGFQPVGTSSSRSVARYGYDTAYGWVSGKLEYSAGTGQWKLRYIPIDGDTDQFGGSVVIANPELLGDRQPNDFVTLRGGLMSASDPNSAFAPLFQVQQIEAI